MMIKGNTVILYVKTLTGYDAFNAPEYSEMAVNIDNVLIGEPSTDEVTESLNLYGKMLAYTLAIPKGDTHDWENQKISFFGHTFQSYGFVTQGIEENIPLEWNKKVKVELIG